LLFSSEAKNISSQDPSASPQDDSEFPSLLTHYKIKPFSVNYEKRFCVLSSNSFYLFYAEEAITAAV
jgi:hypothetical protein